MNKSYAFSTLLLLIFAFCGGASASDIQTDGIYYNFDDVNLTAEVTYKGKCRCGGNTYEGVITIPETVTYEGKTYRVTSIGEYAFSSNMNLTGVIIPTTIESIGYSAFIGCRKLTDVTFKKPSNVKTIDRLAFLSCKELKSIEIPSSVEYIEPYAFEMCDALSDVTFEEPSALTEIKDYVFCRTGLSHVAVPSSVNKIDDVAFCSNPNMTRVFVPSTVTSISARNPFCYNTQVTEMVVEDGNPVYDSRNDCNAIIETESNTLVAGCKTTVIPASVTALGRSSFNHCTDLEDANLPATIKSIGKYAYLGCTGLKSFYFPSTMSYMADSVFWQAKNLDSLVVMTQRPFTIDESDFEDDIYNNATLYVPAGTKSLYRSAAVWSNFRNIVEMDRFVVDGISYEINEDGEAVVVAPSEGVPYSGTVVVPESVKSGVNTYSVSGVSSDVSSSANDSGDSYKVIIHKSATTDFTAYGGKGYIRIEGSEEEAQIINTGGTTMAYTTKRTVYIEPGVYFVKIGDKTVKVAVK